MQTATLEATARKLLEAVGAEIESLDLVGSERPTLKAQVRDSHLVIGPNGEHLRAINHVLKRLLEKETGEEPHVAYLLDANGFFEKKNEAVRANARMLGERARLFKHDVEMSPVSAYERMLIHELFANDPQIKTESQGEGKFRHVVLKYVESSEKKVS